MSGWIRYRGSDGCPLHALGLEGDGGRSDRPPIVLMHGGGPDHASLLPLAKRLVDLGNVYLPDVRGYGRSVCTDPDRHRWAQYADDAIRLLERISAQRAILGGAGMGGTIALRAAARYPERVQAAIVMSLEDIEDDAAKQAEIEFMDAFAERARRSGLEAAWAPVLPGLAPVIGAMVREAMPRADPQSIAAAAAIGRDRSFHAIEALASILPPVLVFPGMDWRHPSATAEAAVAALPRGQLAEVGMTMEMRDSEDFARQLVGAIRAFIVNCCPHAG